MLGTIIAIGSLATAVLGLQFTILTKILSLYERMVRLETQMLQVVQSGSTEAVTITQLLHRVTMLEGQVRKSTEGMSSGS